MKAKVTHSKFDLERSIQALRADEPSPEMLAASRAHVRERFFGDEREADLGDAFIRGCSGVEALLPAYRRGTLSVGRTLLVRAHLAECAHCRRIYARRGTLQVVRAPWEPSTRIADEPRKTIERPFLLVAAALTLCIGLWMLHANLGSSPVGPLATVQAVSGALYRVDAANSVPLSPGATLGQGQTVRAGDAAQSQVRLADGSVVELGERAEVSVESTRNDTTLRLKRGQIIVQAAKRSAGHLYVAARDCNVAVTGTVFSVMTDLKGSRVSVIEGQVQVAKSAGERSVLSRGDQLTTSPALGRVPIEREVAWSRNLDQHLALLHEMTDLGKKWRALRPAMLRYESQVLDFVPENALLYATLPNYGDSLTEGYRLFRARLDESPVLRDFMQSSSSSISRQRLDAWFDKLQDLSSYLGNELVVTAVPEGHTNEVVVLAAVVRPGIRKWIGSEVTMPSGERLPLVVYDEQELASGTPVETGSAAAVLLVTPTFIALSSSFELVRELAMRSSAGDRGAFTATGLGQRVSAAYGNGVDLFVAADLETLGQTTRLDTPPSDFERNLRTIEFEHKEVMGQGFNSGTLSFAEPGRGAASWLASPAPMGSLDFVTQRATAVAAFIVRRPASVLAELLQIVPNSKDAVVQLPELEKTLDHRLADEFAEAIGSELAVALDGPMLPVPAWKVIAEARDPERMERALESWFGRVDAELRIRNAGSLRLEHDGLGTYTSHRVRWIEGSLPFEAHYAFVDGYLVATPTRALLVRAIETRNSGKSLVNNPRFSSLLPRDGRAAFSGILFQDLASAIATAVGGAEPSPDSAQQRSLDDWARESKPSLIAFYAEPDRIEMAANGDLLPFGPEALALPALIRHILPKSNPARP